MVIDEVQKLPSLLDEVHRLIEKRRFRFVLTGSSARKLRRSGANLLAGRARTLTMHPFTAAELAQRFDLAHAIRFGMLPSVWAGSEPGEYLRSYVGTYIRQEVQHEALVRNLAGFNRFLEAAGCLLYGGRQSYRFGPIEVVPLETGLAGLAERLSSSPRNARSSRR